MASELIKFFILSDVSGLFNRHTLTKCSYHSFFIMNYVLHLGVVVWMVLLMLIGVVRQTQNYTKG